MANEVGKIKADLQDLDLEVLATGEALHRLDFAAHGELREKVAVINTNEELDQLFAQYGE